MEKKEKDLTAALEDLQTARLKETELRGLFEEQQLQHKKAGDEKTKALEVMPCISVLQLTSCTKGGELTSYFCSIYYAQCFLFNNYLKALKLLLNVHSIYFVF